MEMKITVNFFEHAVVICTGKVRVQSLVDEEIELACRLLIITGIFRTNISSWKLFTV